ncbi:hypothetical protein QAD02_002407 [Eretmocerus hayati]|uniref:Uncharacterized protein n=1 Tax=Eretmocerus hayati TaxID=131215 RepID=A0ACC2NK12_9HYME|nr:hypothetical protein QAD02_002407 [Eretmocerus hayati]
MGRDEAKETDPRITTPYSNLPDLFWEDSKRAGCRSRIKVYRSLGEIVDSCAGIPSLLLGDSMNNIATDMDTISYRVPLGVTGCICPFNFPAMVPLWTFPISIACGNTVVLKPSERVPGASMILADLFREAGAPAGVLNIIHGQHEAVDFMCDHPDIEAISFVGSDEAVSDIDVSCDFRC